MVMTILLADDNQTFVSAVRKFLDLIPGTKVIGQAGDGHETLRKARQLQPDLVLLDISMPEMSGLEVARQMRSWQQAPQLVFLSMHDSVDYRAAARELSAAGFIGKADFVVDLPPLLERLSAAKPDAFRHV